MMSPENIHTSTQTAQVVFTYLGIYRYTYMYVATSNDRRGHEFEREQGGLYGRLWRKEKEGGNHIIYFQKIRKN